MSKIHCRLIAHSMSDHVQQIYTGLSMLDRRGIIQLTQETVREGLWINHARVILNGRIRLHYDVFDGWKIDDRYLNEADLYFKRSYAPHEFEIYGDRREKIHPLGLNYSVHPDTASWFAFRRALTLSKGVSNRMRQVLRSINVADSIFFTPRVGAMESAPELSSEPRVLFMVNTRDPYDDPQRSKDVIEERMSINEVRAECIRKLRKEFGEHFYGGFRHTKYAVEKFPDLLVKNASVTPGGQYIAHMRNFPICVATTGLHGSIGWKFAEYVAFSKAIIAEKLTYELPGRIADGVNYLSFETPQGCVEAAIRLFSDTEFRRRMMAANFQYYHNHLRPDAMILNTLLIALSTTASS